MKTFFQSFFAGMRKAFTLAGLALAVIVGLVVLIVVGVLFYFFFQVAAIAFVGLAIAFIIYGIIKNGDTVEYRR